MRFFALDLGDDVQFVAHDGGDPCAVVAGPVSRWAEIERLPKSWERFDWSTETIEPDLDHLVSILIARVDRERAEAGETVLTAGRGVALAYDRKGDEARQVGAMTVDEIAGVEGAAARWPFLAAEAAAREVSLVTVAAEVRAGRAASETYLARIEAKARVAKLAIRAATDEAAMRAAADVDWSE